MIEIALPKVDVYKDIDRVSPKRFNYYSFDGWQSDLIVLKMLNCTSESLFLPPSVSRQGRSLLNPHLQYPEPLLELHRTV